MEHSGRSGCGVGAENEAEGFVGVPRVAVADGAVFAGLVDLFDVLPVLVIGLFGFEVGVGGVCAGFVCVERVGYVKGVLEVSGRVLLGDEKSVEVPEAGLDVTRRY